MYVLDEPRLYVAHVRSRGESLIRRRREPTAKLNRINYYAASSVVVVAAAAAAIVSPLADSTMDAPLPLSVEHGPACRHKRFISDWEALRREECSPRPRLETGPLSPERDGIRTILVPSTVTDETSASSDSTSTDPFSSPSFSRSTRGPFPPVPGRSRIRPPSVLPDRDGVCVRLEAGKRERERDAIREKRTERPGKRAWDEEPPSRSHGVRVNGG